MRSRRLEQRILETRDQFTESEALIGEALMQNVSPVIFGSANVLARQIGVSEATLVRFARTIGYESYSHQQRDLQDEIQEMLNQTTTSRLQHAMEYPHDTPMATLVKSFKLDMENLQHTLDLMDAEAFNKAVSHLARAKKIYVVGFRASSGVASHMSYLLNLVHDDVHEITIGTEVSIDRLFSLGEEDAVVVIAMSRPTARVLELVSFAGERNAFVVLITDALKSAIVDRADVTIRVDSTSCGHVQSYTAVTAVCSAVAYALALTAKDSAGKRLELAENLLLRFHVWADGAARGK